MPAIPAFRASPFSLVADASSAACWAGRKTTLAQLHKLCRAWINRSDSTLDVVWANLGAGKTHALFHLRHLLGAEFSTDPPPIVIFAEVPERDGHFIEIYRRLMSSLPIKDIAKLGIKVDSNVVSASIVRACRALEFGDENEQRLANDWISAARPGLRELKALTGIDSRIETDVDANRVLSEILGLAALDGRTVVILLDEFQRIGNQGQRTREALLSHIRALFSRRSSHLSIVLAVGSRIEKTALDLLPAELRTIMGMRPPISLPEMDKAEALEFLIHRLAWYRPAGYSGTPECPFTQRQLEYVINYLADTVKVRLIPRTILQVFGIVYDEISSLADGRLSEEQLHDSLGLLRWDEP